MRSISDADINCDFSFKWAWRGDGRGDMNAASYVAEAGRGKFVNATIFRVMVDFKFSARDSSPR